MSLFIPTCSESVLIVVDLQPSFLRAIDRAESIVARAQFLGTVAQILEVPVLATVQNPDRMGGSEESIDAIASATFSKMAFSCFGCPEFITGLKALERRQAILVGIETHICVSQTAHHLLDDGLEVSVCADAVGARTQDRHEIGLERIRQAGAAVVHSESIAYEWMQSASHPQFRTVLEAVKAAP